jgi:uncharacterized protein YlxW (UPF0749 family)
MIFLQKFKFGLFAVLFFTVASVLAFLFTSISSLQKANKVLSVELEVKNMQVQELSNSLNQFQRSIQLQRAQLNNLSARSAEIERDAQEARAVFERNNLEQLSAAKPGLIQIRVNRATQNVFDTIEKETRDFQNELLQ